MKRIYLYLVVLLGIFVFNASPALAQEDYVISGTVLDEYEKPLPGATVRAIGLDKAVTTDKDGKYQIVVPKNTKLEVSFVGFVTKTTNGGRVKLKATTTSVGGVEVVSKKKQDLKKVKFVDPKAMISAVDTLLKRMPTAPPAGQYDTAVVHAYIKNEVYERFKKNPEVMTGIANAYYKYEGARKNWVIKGVSVPDTFLITNYFCKDSLVAYKYIDHAISADSTYGKSYLLGGNIQRDEGHYLEAMKWYRRGMKNAPKSPDNYLAFAKLVINSDTTSALKAVRELAKNDTIYPANLELARMYYDIDQLAYALDYFEKAFWADSTKRSNFTETDYLNYMASAQVTYNLTYGRYLKNLKPGAKKDSAMQTLYNTAMLHTKRFYNVASYGLGLYPENEGLIRQAFYLTQRLEMNDTAKVYAEKLFAMPNVKLITDDYLTYAKLFAAMGDLPSADKKYNEAFTMCLTQTDETRKESETTESALKLKRLQRQLDNLKNNEDVIVNEHTRLYSEDYERKISIAQYYIDKKKGFGRKDYVEELNQLGAALAVKAQAVDTAKMVNAWKQVDAVYAEMAELSPKDAALATYYRLLAMKNIDVLTNETTGVEFCESIIAASDIYSPMDNIAKNNMINAYDYLIRYHYELWRNSGRIKNKRSQHWVKLDQYSGDLMIIDPSNELAAQISGWIY